MFLGIEQHPFESLAVKDDIGQALTYGELIDAVSDMADRIRSRCVAFCLCKNTVGAVVGYLAMVEAGIVPIMLSASAHPDLLKNLYDEYLPSLVWMPAGFAGKHGNASVFSRFDYELFDTGIEPYPVNGALELCMSTSGSTGSPKLVRYKQGNLEANARNVAKAFEWTPAERALADLGIQYTMGLNVINTHLYVGATILLTTHNIMGSDYWDYLEKERATNLTGVPFTYEVFSRLHFEEKSLPYLTTIAEGGGRLTDKRFRELSDYAEKYGKRFFATFGTTETSARLSYLPPQFAKEKCGSIGRAIPEGEIFLIDGNGNRIMQRVAEGEMCYSGPNVTMGYARRKEDLLLGDEWNGTYRTGDLARRDEDGFYYITGRISRFLKLLGHRVSLDECERMIQEGLGVICACLGSDEQMLVYVEAPGNAEDCIAYLSSKLSLRRSLFSGISIPQLPRSDSGKIAYNALEG